MTDDRPKKPPNGKCPNDDPEQGIVRKSCPLQCKYNFFESDELTIHTYELKCLDCGWRDTIGYRSDDDEQPADPSACPYCQQCDLKTGKNPCQAVE